MVVVTNLGEVSALTKWLNQTLTLKLYSNDVTPEDDSTASTFTECTASGYSAKTLSAGGATVTGGDPTSAAYAPQTFTLTGAATVYGYYVVNGSNDVEWAERLPNVYTCSGDGGSLSITPRVTAS